MKNGIIRDKDNIPEIRDVISWIIVNCIKIQRYENRQL